EDEDVVILVKRDRAQKCARLFLGFGEVGRLRGIKPQRRDAHRLAGLPPVLAVDPPAVDAPLAFADHAVDVGEHSDGNRASRKRSTRIPDSSAVTATVWTLAASAGSRAGATTSRTGGAACGAAARVSGWRNGVPARPRFGPIRGFIGRRR